MKRPTKGLNRIITIGLATLLTVVGSSILFSPAASVENNVIPTAHAVYAAEQFVFDAPSGAGRERTVILPTITPLASMMPIQTEAPAASEEVEVIEVTEDRTRPIYEVYKNGTLIYNDPNISWLRNVDDSPELQWMIRDFAIEYGYREEFIFSVITFESTWQPNLKGDNGRSHGLAQIQRYWLSSDATRAGVPRFAEGDPRDRDLLIPYDNLLTLMEIWEYARDKYNIDITTDQGLKDLYYWHNSGKFIRNVNWRNSNTIFGFMSELVLIQYDD